MSIFVYLWRQVFKPIRANCRSVHWSVEVMELLNSSVLRSFLVCSCLFSFNIVPEAHQKSWVFKRLLHSSCLIRRSEKREKVATAKANGIRVTWSWDLTFFFLTLLKLLKQAAIAHNWKRFYKWEGCIIYYSILNQNCGCHPSFPMWRWIMSSW